MKRRSGCLWIFLIPILAVIIVLTMCSKEKSKIATYVAFSDLPKNMYDADLFYASDGFVTYPGALSGIDVSAHQKEIRWNEVKNAGIDFAIIRCAYRGYTDGGISADPYFVSNLHGAKENGIQVGVYFFSQAISSAEAEEEARFLLDYLDGETLDLPVFYDWEYVDAEARTKDITGREATDFALAFCNTIENAGYTAGVYFNASMGYSFFRLPELKEYTFWMAQYQSKPDFYYDFAVWQYSDCGSVDGIEEPVDMNLLFLK